MADKKDQVEEIKEGTKEEAIVDTPAKEESVSSDKTENTEVEETKKEESVENKTEIKEEVQTDIKPESKPEPTGKYASIIKDIESLSVKDLAQLVKELEDRFGVSAAAPAAMAGGAVTGAVAEVVEEKSEYSVMLVDAGAQKIAVIKAVREIRPDLGLKEAKDLVDGAPKEVKANAPTEEAKAAKTKLETAGAKVELK